MVTAMEQVLTHDDALAARQTLMEAMQATHYQRIAAHEYIEVPDHRTRAWVASKILEWTIGKPRQSVEISHRDADGDERRAPLTQQDLVRLLAADPGLVGKILDEVADRAKRVTEPTTPAGDAAPRSESAQPPRLSG